MLNLILYFYLETYAQENLKRLDQELKYLANREPFLFLPKREIISDNTDEIKTSSSSILRPDSEKVLQGLIQELEENDDFKEEPVNAGAL